MPNSNFQVGQQLQMWGCNGSDAQKWTFTGGTLRAARNNKCMDVTGASTQNNAVIQIVDCNGNAAQQFVLSAAGDLVNPQSGRCLDIKDWNANDGAQLIIYDCTGGANQKWRRA